jgi:crotonobetainyl-CoA:carnitine CoA-transferase CaiB-like acyl-CoA transferase
MRSCGAIIDFDRPGHGSIETVDSPIFVAGSEKRKPQEPPQLGADTRGVLREAGFSESEIERMIGSGIALSSHP